MRQTKALALLSGGLDSMLAVKVIQAQGIHVEAVNFFTGFCIDGYKEESTGNRLNAISVAEQLGIKIHIIDISDEYRETLLRPKHGYGKNLNPCIDCKIHMLRKAIEWIEANDFDFLFTGEVIGQRPMSQRRDTLRLIERSAATDGRLLRPLSARNLPPTRPEQQGLVDREQLHAISGRSRKEQIALARHFGIERYSQPSGGCCLLTEKSFSGRLADLWNARQNRDYELDDILLLRIGRHIRLNDSLKLIIGRNEGENRYLGGYRHRFPLITPHNLIGPVCAIDGSYAERDLERILPLVARYAKKSDLRMVQFILEWRGEKRLYSLDRQRFQSEEHDGAVLL
jgi:tRNA-specific 2-thiouridylase